MEAKHISQLLILAGLTVELVYEGPSSDCPHCVDWATCHPAQAA